MARESGGFGLLFSWALQRLMRVLRKLSGAIFEKVIRKTKINHSNPRKLLNSSCQRGDL